MSSPTSVSPTSALPPAAHDFDFLFGRWQVRNERLRERLAGCDEWDHFDAEVETRPVLGGLGNREHYDTDWQDGYRGMAIRLFDASIGQWRIWWSSNRHAVLDTPVVGGFDGDIGNFYAHYDIDGQRVLCRYRWTRLDPGHARWDQAYSTDEGANWETNWVMHFARIEAQPGQPS
jgi:hypothetical protein